MPFYHFHLTDGVRAFRDRNGVELHDLEAAHIYALTKAQAVMHYDRSGEDWSHWAFKITDEKGADALTVPFADAESDNGTNGDASATFQSQPRRR